MTEQKIKEIAKIMEEIEREELERTNPIDLGYNPQKDLEDEFKVYGKIPKGYM